MVYVHKGKNGQPGVNRSMDVFSSSYLAETKLKSFIVLLFLLFALFSSSVLANSSLGGKDIGLVTGFENNSHFTNETNNASTDNIYFEYVKKDFGLYPVIDVHNSTDSPATNVTSNVPLSGEIHAKTDEDNYTDYYILLGDGEEDLEFQTNFSSIKNSHIVFGEPVVLFQTLTVSHSSNSSELFSLNLWDHTSDIPSSFLLDAQQVNIYDGNELISEQAFVSLRIEPNETKQLTIFYTFLPIYKQVTCKEIKLKDIIPEDASYDTLPLPLNTIVDKKCYLSLIYDHSVHYFNITIPLVPFDVDNIDLAYIQETGEQVSIEGNAVLLNGTD